MVNLITYKTYLLKEEASDLIDALTKNNIPNVLEDNFSSFDATFVNQDENKKYYLKIAKDHFETADKLQLDIANKIIDSISADHYLYEFTDEELMDVISKKDEWSALDYLLAQKLLKDRGKEVSQDTIITLENERAKELTKTEPLPIYPLITGYIFASLGGLLGILIGWHLATYKKLLPNGERVYAYSASVRNQGKTIMIIGCSVIFLGLAFIAYWYNR